MHAASVMLLSSLACISSIPRFAPSSRCLASAIYHGQSARHCRFICMPPRLCCFPASHASARFRALRLHLAVWRPPYTMDNRLGIADLSACRPGCPCCMLGLITHIHTRRAQTLRLHISFPYFRLLFVRAILPYGQYRQRGPDKSLFPR